MEASREPTNPHEPKGPDDHADLPPPTARDYVAVAAMGGLFLGSILLAMLVAPTYRAQGIQVVEDPESLASPFIYLAAVLAFTFIILLVAKYGPKWIIQALVLGAVFVSITYVTWPILDLVLSGDAATTVSFILAGALVAVLYFYPEWYVINMTGLMVSAGIAAIFGVSFHPLPVLILLAIFAIYDAIAVYRTRHMLSLADSVLELRLPIMFVVPKSLRYSFLEETRRVHPDKEKGAEKARGATTDAFKGEAAEAPGTAASPESPAAADAKDDGRREAMFMGLGDAVIPGVLAVASVVFLADEPALSVLGMPGPWFVGLVTLLGSFIGFGLLMAAVLKGKPHAGLPLLNGGAIVGFLLALLPTYGLGPLLVPL